MQGEELDALSEQLAERLCEHNQTLCLHLIRLLADGQAVPVERLAQSLSLSPQETASQLHTLSDIEFDPTGNVTAFGLSHAPTAHQFAVNGHKLYTWCALDTFMYTALLDVPTQVHSTCPRTGQSIFLSMTPQGIEHLDPQSAVISLVVPSGSITDCLRSTFCNHGHFFSSAEAAAEWLATQEDALVLPVADAHELGQRIANSRIVTAALQRIE
jgi:alkylmercury lyase